MANPTSDAGESKFTADVNRISSGPYDRLLLRLSNGGRNVPRFVSLPEGSGNSRAGGSGTISMQPYPTPDSEKDCVFFLSTGLCRYRQQCRFKHPTPENTQVETEGTNGTASESQSEKKTPVIPCKFFELVFCQNGGCCSFLHNKPEIGQEYQQVNGSGLPIRWGVPDCSYYLRKGFCGYGLACKFNHPERGEDILYYQNGGYFTKFPDTTQAFYQQDPMIDSSYQVTQPTFSWTGPQSQQLSDGTQEMTSYHVANAEPFYFRPKKPSVKITPLMFNEAGFPLRPGKSVCRHYEKSGDCMYGRACNFHHPETLSSNVDEGSSSKSGSDATKE